MINKNISIIILILFSFFSSCKEVAEKTVETIAGVEKKELIGKYHTIKSEKIKIFLPEEFKHISESNYLKEIQRTREISIFNSEKERLNFVKDAGRKIYLFEYFKGGSMVNILPERYVEFNNSDAKYMLAIIDKAIKSNNHPETTLEIMESQFKGNKNLSIFKVIYKIKLPKASVAVYKYVYFISYNKKSVFVNLETPVLFDFDPYIEKIRL